jgi:transcriptional regulator with XRE-family HTH domain
MDIRRLVGLNVQRLRREKGWSQEDLAFESGLHRTYVSGIERGKRNPTVVILARLAKALGTDAAELVCSRKKSG